MAITYKKVFYSKETEEDRGFTEQYEWETLLELYKVRRGLKPNGVYDARFTSTFLAVYASIFEIVFDSSEFLFDAKHLGIRNGYCLTLLSPFILAYWIFQTGLFIGFALFSAPIFLLALLWALLFEMPADVINNSWNKQKRTKIKKIITDKRTKRSVK